MKSSAILAVAICAFMLVSAASAQDEEKFFFKKGKAGLAGPRGATGPRGPPGTGTTDPGTTDPIELFLVEADITSDGTALTVGTGNVVACPAGYFIASAPFVSASVPVMLDVSVTDLATLSVVATTTATLDGTETGVVSLICTTATLSVTLPL